MGARGATASSEAADAVLTVDELARLGEVAAQARRTRRIALQSVLAGMGLSLAAMIAAAGGLLPAVWGALLQEAIDVAVILNALRALAPVPPEVRLTAADEDLTRRFRVEHQAVRADTEQLRSAAQALGEPGAMDRVRHVHELLTREVWPHERAEESILYPALNRVLGGTDPTAPMSRAHAEIAVQIARLGRLIDDIGDRDPDEADITDLRAILYGLHAILRLHTAQEDETYLSLGDTASAGNPAAPAASRAGIGSTDSALVLARTGATGHRADGRSDRQPQGDGDQHGGQITEGVYAHVGTHDAGEHH
jgi:hypothetical protein